MIEIQIYQLKINKTFTISTSNLKNTSIFSNTYNVQAYFPVLLLFLMI